MSSFPRRMQRAHSARRVRKTGLINFGNKLGAANPKAKDLVARLAREAKRAER